MRIVPFSEDHIKIFHSFSEGSYTKMDAYLCDTATVAVYIHRYVDYKHVSNTRRFLKISEYAEILKKEFPCLDCI